MKKTITAIFENPDAADFALTAMLRDNIPILHHTSNRKNEARPEHDIFYMAPIYSAHRADLNNSIAPLPMLTNSINPTHEKPYIDSVRLQIEIPSNFAKRARSKLVSYHGLNITERPLS